MSWWKKHLTESLDEEGPKGDSLRARDTSVAALAQAETMGAQVEAVSSSLGGHNIVNHFTQRIEEAFALAHSGD